MSYRSKALSRLALAAAVALGGATVASAGRVSAGVQFAQNVTDDLPEAPKPAARGHTKPPPTATDSSPPANVKPPGTKEGYKFGLEQDDPAAPPKSGPNQWPAEQNELIQKPKPYPGLVQPGGPKRKEIPPPASRR